MSDFSIETERIRKLRDTFGAGNGGLVVPPEKCWDVAVLLTELLAYRERRNPQHPAQESAADAVLETYDAAMVDARSVCQENLEDVVRRSVAQNNPTFKDYL